MNAHFGDDPVRAVASLPPLLASAAKRWLERLLERDGAPLLDACDAQNQGGNLLRLVAVSDFAGEVVLRDVAWMTGAVQQGMLERAPEADSDDAPADLDPAAFQAWLRLARNRCLLRILWRDLGGIASVPDTLASLSALADRLIILAARYARRQLAEQSGELRDPAGDIVPLVILAMGKLGGRELNFSSDVDLVFLYPRDGDTDGRRATGAQEFFTRLTRRIVALLEDVTADGFVYRVDTRLRPFGDSGPPVVSFSALESYLVNHGRSWERYAYVKARAILPDGGEAVAESLGGELIGPFVYRRYLDFGVFESLREMKDKIAVEVRRREMAHNIKLGPGGIREIEFIVQSLQLVRGGSNPQLQSTGLRHALRQLMERRGLARADADGLERAYCLLRRVENMLQAMRDQQTHELPDDAADRARLALALGYDDADALLRDIAEHREFVSRQFSSIAFRDESRIERERPGDTGAIAACCDTNATVEEWHAVLDEHGYRDAAELAAELHAFLDSRATRQADATASKRLRTLLPKALVLLRESTQAARVLKRLLGIVSEVLRRSAYVALLIENAAALSRLVDICERSAYLADQVAQFPLLLDEMLDPRVYSARLSAQSLRDELAGRLDGLPDRDSEREVEVLAQFQRAALFRIAAADFGDQLPVMKVSDRLTDLAEIVLERALEIAWRDQVERFGEPCFRTDGNERIAGLGVIAYGKLGGMELSYGSDLDLVFLHNSEGGSQQTRGPKRIENGVFFARLARRLVHFLTVQTGSGALYEVDTRLRPSGQSGLLVTSTEAFERYQQENAWTWEHQALLRGRPVAGSARVAREFERVRAQILKSRVNRESLREDVRQMREKMRGSHDRTSAAGFDLKQGAGGIGDIEFLVQYLVLLHAQRHVAVVHYADNIRQLGTLGATNCLDAGHVQRLQDIYRRYRTYVHRALLDERPAVSPPDEFAGDREFVRQLWEQTFGVAV